jgi:hypothetical protein
MDRLQRRAREINANLRSPESERLALYVERIADARSRAADAPRDAYTLALGQLCAVGLIDEATWRAALDRPRVQ